jgi:hypothetical protein
MTPALLLLMIQLAARLLFRLFSFWWVLSLFLFIGAGSFCEMASDGYFWI